MARPRSTVVVVAGVPDNEILTQLDALPNVRAADLVAGDDHPTPQQLISRAHTSYVVHNKDPLAGVATAWAGYFEGALPYGSVEVAVEAALAELRSEREMLPDYYLVLGPDDLGATEKHWWFGVLASQSPSRVIPVPPHASGVKQALGQLPPGRWWPDPADRWLREASRTIPDQAGLNGSGLAVTL